MIVSGSVQGADSLRGAVERVLAEPAYQWIERPDPWRFAKEALGTVQRWLFELASQHPTLARALVIALLVILVAIVLHAVWILVATTRTARAGLAVPESGTPLRSEAWYREEADRLAADGRYPEAMQADFLALVVALDAGAQLRFHPSKTPAEYLAEIPWHDARRDEFRGLVQSLYGYAFARRPCTIEHFERWRSLAVPERYVAIG